MKLKTYSYECVDTINYSTLIFNIDAVVANADGRESRISKTAEWSVELVSVECYPYIEVWPPHDNIILCYYGNLDRYRNYSDGSRIGPDHFENYGHFMGAFLYFLFDYFQPAINKVEFESIFPENHEGLVFRWDPYVDLGNDRIVVGHEYIDEAGIYVDMGYRVKVNRNAYTKYAEGLIPLEAEFSIDFTKDYYSRREYLPEDFTDLESYIPSFEYVEATDELTVFNMCKDVPIINREDTVREVRSIETGFGLGFEVPVKITEKNVSKSGNQEYWGWYYERFNSGYYERYASSTYLHYYNNCIEIYRGASHNYCSYINIDGRIIDFVDVCKKILSR